MKRTYREVGEHKGHVPHAARMASEGRRAEFTYGVLKAATVLGLSEAELSAALVAMLARIEDRRARRRLVRLGDQP